MCGIVGFISQDKGDYSHMVSNMAAAIAHRGPDNTGKFIDREHGIFFYHRRLSIIDLSSNANQPLFSEDKRIVLLANCEIYNYKSLREELQLQGHIFCSETDTEVIVHAYEQHGLDFVSHLDGMFAFVLWDTRENKLLLARDRIGVKPLYYIHGKGFFAFSSEVKAFFELDKAFWKKEIDEVKIENLVFFPYIPDNENTIFQGAKKVPPGTLIIYNNGVIVSKKYWKLERKELGDVTFLEAQENCVSLLKHSVCKRLQADVPVGILLSGGLDSSLVYSLVKQFSQNVHIFTARYNHRFDESRFARMVAGENNELYHEINIDVVKQIGDNIENIMKYFDDLSTLDGGFFMTYLLAEQVKRHKVKVVLVGDGADEVFGGYSWYGLNQMPFNLLPLYCKASIYYYALSRTFSSARCIRNINDIYRKFKAGDGDIFNRISEFELNFQLPNHFLNRVDKATMAYGIEAREPYLDVDLVSYVYSLPSRLKFSGNRFNFRAVNEKYILREIAKEYVPKAIAGRKKYGFSIPMAEILNLNKEKVYDYLIQNGGPALKYFRKDKILDMLDFKEKMYQPIDKQKEFLVWRLFLISIYMHTVLDR